MIIAINTRLLLTGRMEGIGRFTFEILKRITTKHKEHTFIFFFDRPYDSKFVFAENVIPIVLFPPSRHPILWFWYFEYSISKALKKYHADLFISTDGWMSLKTKVKSLQVLHDLHFLNSPESLPYLTRKYYRYFFPRFIQKANRIVTVSNFSRNEILANYPVDENTVDVVFNSTRTEYHPLNADEILHIRNEYSSDSPYFLFIGPIHPRKNADRIIEAFIEYKKKSGGPEKLLITGAHMWRNFGALKKSSIPNDSQDIIFTGYVSEETLFRITAGASCLLYVSLYEGFGIPILEAMSCDVPVITSNCSAMSEVAGDAALLVNPESVNSIADAIQRIQTNPNLRKELVQKGRINLQRFSWDKSAEKFWKIIEQML